MEEGGGGTCIHSLLEFSIEDLCELSVNPNKLKIGHRYLQIRLAQRGWGWGLGNGGWRCLGNFGIDAFSCKIKKVDMFFVMQISMKCQFAQQSIGNFEQSRIKTQN